MIRKLVFLMVCLIATQAHAQFQIKKDKTGVTRYVMLRDSTSGAPKTGVAATAIKFQYTRNRVAPSAVATATALTTVFTSWMDGSSTGGKAIEVDATSSPGLYRVDWPDAAFATGVDKVVLVISATACDPAVEEIQLTDLDPENGSGDVTRFGKAQGATSTTIQLAAALTFPDNTLVGRRVFITGGTGAGQSRVITGYTGTTAPTDTATVASNWTTTPDSTSTYELSDAAVNVATIDGSRQSLLDLKDFADFGYDPATDLVETYSSTAGTAQSPFNNSTVAFESTAAGVNNYYQYQLLVLVSGTGAGQAAIISSYSTGKVATISSTWAVIPSTDTKYKVIPLNRIGVDSASLTAIQAGTATELTFTEATVAAVYSILSGASSFNDLMAAAGATPTRLGKLDAPLLNVSADSADKFNASAQGIVKGTVGTGSTNVLIKTQTTNGTLDPPCVKINQFVGRILIFGENTATAALRGQATNVISNTADGQLTVTALTDAPVTTGLETFTLN